MSRSAQPPGLSLGFGKTLPSPWRLRLRMLGHALQGAVWAASGRNGEGEGPPPVFILGCHRSGTSCLAGLLEEAGLFLGKTLPADRHNPAGYFENEALAHFDHRWLARRGGSWIHPRVIETASFWERCFVLGLRRHLSRQVRGRPWGLKDPRLMWCLRPWSAGRPRRLVGIFRHPAAVQASLLARRGNEPSPFDGPVALHLWKRHARRLLALREEEDFPLLSFDAPPDAFLAAVTGILPNLGLPASSLKGFRPELRHRTGGKDETVDEESRRLLTALRERSRP